MMYNMDFSKVWNQATGQWISNPLSCSRSVFWDANFSTGNSITVNGLTLFPAYVRGRDYEDWWYKTSWPGIGPSPVSFSMKAFVTSDKLRVFHGTGRDGLQVLVESPDVPAHAIFLISEIK